MVYLVVGHCLAAGLGYECSRSLFVGAEGVDEVYGVIVAVYVQKRRAQSARKVKQSLLLRVWRLMVAHHDSLRTFPIAALAQNGPAINFDMVKSSQARAVDDFSSTHHAPCCSVRYTHTCPPMRPDTTEIHLLIFHSLPNMQQHAARLHRATRRPYD
jgi:hypothetical protein